jgi:MoxR-like ATPase
MSIETYPAYGRDFAIEGIRQLDQIMVGREIPKAAGIVAVAAGVNLVYAGGTGKGKTELALALPQLISDIHPENVAEVPIQNDLSGMQLIGGASTFTKEMVKGDRTTTEHTHTMLDGVIRPETQVVMIDEINRGSPKTFESLLGMLESRRIVTLEGVREVPNLEFVMATMNPHETYEATQPVAHATISRFSAGAIFDRGGSREQRIANVKKIGELPKDAKIEPITDLATIHRMRQDAQKVAMPESMETKIAQLAVNTSDALWEETRLNLDDGEERISTQVRKLARIITILSNETSVNEQAVHNALGLVVAARVGMGHSNAVERGPEIVKNIIGSSF